jgi:amino acid transporter
MMPSAQSSQQAPTGLRRELRLRDLVLFNICAIASLRWIAAAAHAGSGSLVLWVIAAVFFFLPSAVIVAALSERFPEEGGMYVWTKNAFGDQHAFLCGWSYFISNLLYLPSLLLAGVSMLAYVFGSAGERLSEQRIFALPATLGVLWTAFIANFFGLKVAKWISALGGTATYIAAAVLTALAVAAAVHSGITTQFHLLPRANLNTLNFWSQIAFAFVGLELAPIMSGEIRNPQRDVRRAAVISGIGSTLFYMVATASLLVLMPPEAISPMTGLAQAGAVSAAKFGIPAIAILVAALIGFALAGQADAWIAGNTRLPYAIGLDRYLPAAFARIHPRWRTPYISLLVQVVAATALLLMAQFGETVRSAYQILVDMTVIATLIPFVYIFGSGLRFASRPAAASGLAVTVIAIIFSAVPPAEAESVAIFELKVVGGCIVLALIGWLVFKRYEAKRLAGAEETIAG